MSRDFGQLNLDLHRAKAQEAHDEGIERRRATHFDVRNSVDYDLTGERVI